MEHLEENVLSAGVEEKIDTQTCNKAHKNNAGLHQINDADREMSVAVSCCHVVHIYYFYTVLQSLIFFKLCCFKYYLLLPNINKKNI